MIIAPGLRARRAGHPDREEEPAAAALRRTASARAGQGWTGGQVSGGMLMQTADTGTEPGDLAASWKLMAGQPASPETLADLEFAWRACRAVKSNAILLAAGRASVGIGMGQVNRVDSCRLAVARAGRLAAALGRRQRRVTSRSRTACRSWPTPGCGRSPSQAARSVTTRSSRRPRSAGISLYFTGVRHFYH